MKKVLFVASEGLPFIKSGGLADVVGSLPYAIADEGFEVSVVLPLYSKIIRNYYDELDLVGAFKLNIAKFNSDVRVFKIVRGAVKFYFVENAQYFERDGLYGYGDDGERFAFFQHAVYHMMMAFDDYPDILHAHDWHTGMMAALGRITYSENKHIARIKQIYTIHNLAFQGNYDKFILEACLAIPMEYYDNGSLRFRDGVSYMKAGIVFADKISTVSNTYAQEIMTEQFGEGLDSVLRARSHDVWGIVNGLDVDLFNPKTDKNIYQNFDVNSLDLKVKNKRSLQYDLGLRESDDVCLVGMVSRLSWQKGINLLLYKLKDIMGLDIQLVILGTGEDQFEYDLRQSENMYKRRMVYYGGYSDEVAHKIYAGADLFLMPSLFEPCGLAQMISMRYGTLPIVRETGGLKDTVAAYNQFEKTGTGFSFNNFNAEELYNVLRMAVDTYYLNPADFKMLQTNAMNSDFTWKKSAQLYIQMYQAAGMI